MMPRKNDINQDPKDGDWINLFHWKATMIIRVFQMLIIYLKISWKTLVIKSLENQFQA